MDPEEAKKLSAEAIPLIAGVLAIRRFLGLPDDAESTLAALKVAEFVAQELRSGEHLLK